MGKPKTLFSTLKERSDVDPHQTFLPGRGADKALGDYVGDGVWVSPEPVVVHRDARNGRIVRTESLDEARIRSERAQELQEHEIEVGEPLPSPGGLLPRSRREKLVFILAKRMFDYYNSPEMMKDVLTLNPIRDGIPTTMSGQFVLEMTPQTADVVRRRVTPGEAFDWFKAFIGSRVQLVEKKNGWTGTPSLANMDLRINRSPVR